jgi:uncharacterized membrane protein
MTEPSHPIMDLTHADLDAMLKRAFRKTLILGVLSSVVVWIGGGWRNAATLATGTAISAASILEWQRLVRTINARLDKQRVPAGTSIVILFFVIRLTVFAGVIYVSLKCFNGSITALLCGLCLAVLTIGWEAIRLLRD